jgi:hypothetical protein
VKKISFRLNSWVAIMIAYHHCTATLPSEPFGLFFPLLTGDDYFDPSSARLPIFLPTTLSAVFARDLGSLFYPPMATSLSQPTASTSTSCSLPAGLSADLPVDALCERYGPKSFYISAQNHRTFTTLTALQVSRPLGRCRLVLESSLLLSSADPVLLLLPLLPSFLPSFLFSLQTRHIQISHIFPYPTTSHRYDYALVGLASHRAQPPLVQVEIVSKVLKPVKLSGGKVLKVE